LTGVDQTSSALISISGGTITGSKVGGDISETIIGIDAGSVSANAQITLSLSGIQNPTVAGMSADYKILTDDGMSANNTGQSTVSGHVFTAPSINIFTNGFEDTVVVKAAQNTVALLNKRQIGNQPIAELDQEMSQYLFMNQSLSMTENGRVRTMDEVMAWFKAILIENAATGDFDADGISNEFDTDPFGIVPN